MSHRSWKEALSLLGRAFEVVQNVIGPERLILADIHHNLGCCFQATGDLPQALTHFMMSLRIREKFRDPSGEVELKLALTILNAFKVGKSAGLSRLVLDGTPINEVQPKPPSMELPKIHDILREVASFNCFASVDGTSYFYQFAVHEDIAKHFSFIINERRGRGGQFYLSRLCMGWKYAPYIAQRVSNLLCKVTKMRLDFDASVVAWLDNFLFATKTEAQLEKVIETFKKVS